MGARWRRVDRHPDFFRNVPVAEKRRADSPGTNCWRTPPSAISHGKLRHDQRAARAGFGLAEAAEQTTDVRIDDWSLRTKTVNIARIVAQDFFRPRHTDATDPAGGRPGLLAQGS
jgi:predicted secreted hydrolase